MALDKFIYLKKIDGFEDKLKNVGEGAGGTAEDVESYDRTTELEKLGGDVIDLRLNEWTALAA